MTVGANILLYARNEADPRHEAAEVGSKRPSTGRRASDSRGGRSAFVRIATNPRAFANSLTPADAASQVDEWLDAPRAWIAEPTAQYRHVFTALVRAHDVRGLLVTDAQLAALAIDHGVPIVSNDADFGRFRGVEWIDPLSVDGR